MVEAQGEEGLLNSPSVCRAIVESATGFAVIATDMQGIVSVWNPGAERILGWRADEMLGRSADVIFTAEDRTRGAPDAERRTAVEHGEARDERWHLKSDGTRFWGSGEMMPLRGTDGVQTGFLKILRDRTDAMASERETRRSRDELQVVTDALPVLIAFIDRDHVYRFNNRFYETWLDRPAGSIVGRHMREILGPEFYAERVPYLERALQGEEVVFDARMPYRGGGDRQSEIRYIPRLCADGLVEGCFVMVTDLTERNREQAAIREAEDRLRLALQAAHTGIYDFDLVTGRLTWDRRTKALFGLPPDAEIDYERDYLGNLHPEDRDRAAQAVEEAILSRDGFHLEYRIIDRNGIERRLAANGTTVFRGDRPVRFIGTVRDITAAWAAERQASRLAALVEQSTDFIGIADLDGTPEIVNPAGLRMVGLAGMGEARAQDLVEYFAPQHRSTVRDEVLPLVRERGFWEGDLAFRNFATGADVPVHYTLFPVRDAAGAVTGYGTVTRDLTERRRAESFRNALIEFGDRLQECRDTAEMAVAGAEIMGRTLGVDRAGYGTVDDAVEFIDIERDWNAPGVTSIAGRHQFDRYGSFRAGLEQGHEVVIPDITLDARTRDASETLLGLGIRALLNVPVVEHGRVVALFFLHDGQPRDWRPDKLVFIREIAERTRAAIERFRAEMQRRESEEQFRVFAQVIPNQVWAANPDGSIIWFNEQFYRYSGEPRGSLLGPDAWTKIVHPDDLEEASQTWSRARESGERYETEYRLRRTDGAYRWFVARGEPVRDGSGRTIRWVGTNTDVQDYKTAAAELARLNTGLEQQVEERTRERDRSWRNTQDIQVVIDGQGIFKAVNPAFTAILGWTPEDVLGKPVFEFIVPEDEAVTERALQHARVENLPIVENRYRHKGGGFRWISWVAAPERDLIYASGRHITAEKEQAEALQRTEEALRQAQKMEAVGQLTGGLAHDFNNLLAGISGSLELMGTRMSQGRYTELDRYMGAAQGAAKRAAALTHRLLAFSRRQTLDPRATDVNRLVAGMEELIRRTVGPSITLEVVAAGGLWTTLVDPPQLENALLNLCINARDAMPDGGRLTIETGNRWLDRRAAAERDMPPGQYISLCVSDTGSGMTPDVIAKAFDPFFTTKPIGQGTGLGLSMIYGFARQSGGQVRIYSEPGQGSMICIYLPRLADAEEEIEEVPELAGAPRAEAGETVLVVDDEPTVRMLVTEVLQELGYAAIEAADASSGLKVLQSDARIDLLVSDVGLPGGMNGRQMADAARVSRPDLRILFITGYAENAAIGNGHLERGMQVLTKPFAMEALASRIKEMITSQ